MAPTNRRLKFEVNPPIYWFTFGCVFASHDQFLWRGMWICSWAGNGKNAMCQHDAQLVCDFSKGSSSRFICLTFFLPSKLTWLSSSECCEKNNKNTRKRIVFLQPIDMRAPFFSHNFVKECNFNAQTQGRRERKRKGKKEDEKERGRERGKGKLEVKLWQKRKKSQTPQPGIEPGTPANAADALPLSHRDKRHHQLVCSKFYPFCLHFTT